MIRKRFTAEQIVHKLREAEVEVAKGRTIPEVCKKISVTDQAYYRWFLVTGLKQSPRSPDRAWQDLASKVRVTGAKSCSLLNPSRRPGKALATASDH